MMTAANRETAVLAVQTVKEVSNMGNRPVNRSRRSAGRGNRGPDVVLRKAAPAAAGRGKQSLVDAVHPDRSSGIWRWKTGGKICRSRKDTAEKRGN